MKFEALRSEALEANLSLWRSGTVLLTWGNVSAYDEDLGVVAIKPSGVAYDAMRVEDIVVLDLEGRIVEGSRRPSSDTPTHLALYRALRGLRGIAHTHSTYATAFAQARVAIPALGTTHADAFFGEIPVTRVMTEAQIGGAYEENTEKVIAEALAGRDPLEMPAVLVAGHGPFTWGSRAAKAVENAIILEEVARLAFLTFSLAPEAPPISRALLERHFLRKHGPNAYYGQAGVR